MQRMQHAAVVLRHYAGLSDREIATQLGCREPTVRSQIHRALKVLRVDLTANAPDFQETS